MTSSGLMPGSLFARDFRIVRRLGEGGMGRVYVVEQLSTGALRALKLMHPVLERDERFVRRFEQEAKVGSRIESDHIVHVVAAGVDDESRVPWLAMELLEGERLSDLLEQRGVLTILETQEVMAQLCHGLAAAHAIGVVHRDLKPENIFLARARREGIPFTVKLLDFGIAKVIADEVGTSRNEALGSVLWMAPEQTLPESEASATADVWSLGLLAFRMLAGFPYWRAASLEPISSAMVLREVVLDSIAPASFRAAELGVLDRIPEGFDAWFAQCVVRETRKRFADAGAAKVALMHVLHAAGGVSPDPDPSVASRASLMDAPVPRSALPTPSSPVEPTPSANEVVRVHSPQTTGNAVLPSPSRARPRPAKPVSWLRYALSIVVLTLIAAASVLLLFRRHSLSGACQSREPAACQKLCELPALGSPHDCLRAGDLFQRAAAAPSTPPAQRAIKRAAALRSFRAACDRAVVQGCTRAAVILQQGIVGEPNALRDEKAAATLLARACQAGKGDVAGCVLYGAALRMGRGTGRNDDNEEAYSREAAEYFRRDCDPVRGGRGCYWLGYLYQYGGGGLAKSAELAESRFRLGCLGGKGDPEACNHLAEFSEHGRFTPREELLDAHFRVFPANQPEAMDRYDQARKLWALECKEGEPRACLEEALLLWHGKSENPNPARAAELFQLSCDMGFAPSCHRLHLLCSSPASPSIPSGICDSERSLRKACDGLWAPGCLALGENTPALKDKELAFRKGESLLQDSCEGGSGESCLRLAVLYGEGKPGIERNVGRSTTYLDRACDREEPEACKRLGDSFRSGEGVAERQLDLSLRQYRKACDLLHGGGCYNAAIMLRAGAGAAADPAQALQLFRESCDLQTAAACLELARLYERGEGVKQDVVLARKYQERACTGCEGESVPEACAALGLLLLSDKSAFERARGQALLVSACDHARLETACRQAARNWSEGVGTERNLTKAREYSHKACVLSGKSDCPAP